ncbi:hypothetical protein [Pelomonas sp. SE-A7]|uniref:hypothetical protein n=1 Tax=Pelomonas sp. SE-A7 TaxID=3054953 RepID=UPI00259C9A8F|nr:hypothetical protein [Pelomonas sp. SE-A7]MDM4768490.1 hypothetical protein [Pelomonas sp. SE-A7]
MLVSSIIRPRVVAMQQWIEQNLVWLAVGLMLVVALLGAFSKELPRLLSRELMSKLGRPRVSEATPPPEHGRHGRTHGMHDAPAHKPAFHRSGRRH